jgi:hypothetical protein
MKQSRVINNRAYQSKLIKKFKVLSHQILEYSNRGDLRGDFQREISKMLLDFTRCDAIEFWLNGHGKYFRSEMIRRPGKPSLFNMKPYPHGQMTTQNSSIYTMPSSRTGLTLLNPW